VGTRTSTPKSHHGMRTTHGSVGAGSNREVEKGMFGASLRGRRSGPLQPALNGDRANGKTKPPRGDSIHPKLR